MSIPTVIKAALDSLVDSRVFPNTFPQEINFSSWPAIRYTVISSDNAPTVCGTDGIATDDVLVQLDLVAKTYSALMALRDAAITSLMTLTPPPVRAGMQETFDAETKTHRAILEVTFYQSSAP